VGAVHQGDIADRTPQGVCPCLNFVHVSTENRLDEAWIGLVVLVSLFCQTLYDLLVGCDDFVPAFVFFVVEID